MSVPSLHKVKEQFQQAIHLSETAQYQKAIRILEEICPIFQQYVQWELYLECLNEIGKNHNYLGNGKKAIEVLNTALETAKNHGLEPHILLIFTYNSLGYAYGNLQANPQLQQKAYQNALQLAQNTSPTLELYPSALALTYSNLGSFHQQRNEYTTAQNFHQKALNLYLQSSDDSQQSLAICHNNLGACYNSLGDYAQALSYFQKAHYTWQKLLPSNHPHFVYIHHNIATCFYSKLQHQAAIEEYEKALKIAINQTKPHRLTASIYTYLGKCYNKLQQFDKALEYFQQTQKIQAQLYRTNTSPSIAVLENQLSLANCYTDQQQFDKAFPLYKHILEDYQQLFGEQHPKLADILNTMANAYLQKTAYEQAIHYFHQSLRVLLPEFETENVRLFPPISHISFSKQLLFALNRKSLAFYHLHQKTQQIKDLEAALNGYTTLLQFIDFKRQDYKAYDSKLDLGEQLIGIYEKAIEVAFTLSKVDNSNIPHPLQAAFTFAEKSKAILLLSDLKGAEAMGNIPEKLRHKEEQLRRNLSHLDKQIQEAKTQKNTKKIRLLEEEHFDQQQVYLQLIARFEKEYPDYFQLKYNLEVASVEQLQAHLQAPSNTSQVLQQFPSTTILSFYVGEQFIFIFQITAQDFQVYQISKSPDFEELVTDLLDAINAVDVDDFLEIAAELGADLLLPVQEFKKPTLRNPHETALPQLIILRHGVLNYLPFGALLLEEEGEDFDEEFTELPYLIRQFNISYHYSATLLLYQAQQQKQATFLEDSFLGIAPVSFNAEEQPAMAMISRGGKTKILRSNQAGEKALQNLPSTENEVKAVFELFQSQGLEAKVFLYASASKQNLFSEAPKYKYILISTHGMTHTENAKLSGIYLAKPTDETDTNSNGNDYLLYTSETYYLQLQADLVILSSCSSGIGKLYNAEGMMALHRGFLYAGANNIIFTQFDIPDESSSALVQKLFGYILEGANYAIALRKAKMDLLEEEAYTPQDWAGFLLIANS